MEDRLLNETKLQTSLPTNCQVQSDTEVYYKRDIVDSYRVSLAIKLDADNNEELEVQELEVQSLIYDIKQLLFSRHKNIASKLIENIDITRSHNQVIVNSWKEGINENYPDYLNASKSLQFPQREQFVGTNLGNTREGKTDVSLEGSDQNSIS